MSAIRRLLPVRRRWEVIAALWLFVFVLGFTGLSAHPTPEAPRSTLDNLYLSLQLFGLGFPIELASLDWRLQFARFAGPAVTASAFLTAAAVLFRDQFEQARLRFAHDHVVVCGLGEKGYRLAAGFQARGRRVVAIERDPAADHLGAARAAGITVLIGDASDAGLLARTHLATASELIAVCGDDGTNAEVASLARNSERLAASGATKPGRPLLRCSIHLLDPQLCGLLRHQALRDTAAGIRVEFFNIYESGARMWLGHAPPFDASGGPAHVVVVGLDELGQSLAVCAVQRWADQDPSTKLRLTLVDADASGRLQAVRLRHPGLGEHCEPATIDLDPLNPTTEAVDAFDGLLAREAPTAVYVCYADDALSLSTGLAIRQRLADRNVPVAVRTRSDAGLAVLLRTGSGAASVGLDGFGLLDRACTAEAIEGGVHEQVARAIHDDYRARNPGGQLAIVWEDLPEGVRESNRLAADHIAAGLRAIGCDLVPLHRWGTGGVELRPDELELLASREHDRWRAERERDGWRYGAARDDALKRNPLLVPWDKLPEDIRRSNLEAAAKLPAMLARAGFEIVRTAAPAAGPTG